MWNQELSTAVGKIPSGLFIICAKQGEQIDGFLGSWIQQVSFQPLLISLCIKPGRPAYEAIMAQGVFSVNIVGDHKKDLLKPFWSGYDPEKKPFDQNSYQLSERGSLLLEEAYAVIECKKVQSLQPGDHELVIAEVLNSYTHTDLATTIKPIIHLRKNGTSY